MHCDACARDVIPTTYGRCPMCGGVLAAAAALSVDARAAARGRSEPEPAAPSACGDCLLVGLGLPALMAFFGLVHVGNAARWTSDGPGILIVMIGVVVTGCVALTTLGGLVLSRFRLGRWILELLDD